MGFFSKYTKPLFNSSAFKLRCGNCNADLMRQEGFSSSLSVWACKECGCENHMNSEEKMYEESVADDDDDFLDTVAVLNVIGEEDDDVEMEMLQDDDFDG